jgi:hypothetical protein
VSFWWVNQGRTYAAERQGSFLWAPQATKKGAQLKHWTDMTMVRVDDVVLHFADSRVRAISRVTRRAIAAPRPESLPDELWERDGWLVRVEMTELQQPIKRDEIPLPMRSSPAQRMFTSAGVGNQGYLYPIELEWFGQFAHIFANRLGGTVAADADVPAEIRGSAEAVLHDLIGQELHTLLGRNNTIEEVRDGFATVLTDRSPDGRPVPVAEVQAALDQLRRDGSVICPDDVGYRSAFIGAVLRTLPGTSVRLKPPTVSLTSRLGELPVAPQGPLDTEVTRLARTEQGPLRESLIANRRLAPCALCGHEMSVKLLVAAHIKQRSECSDDEKRDLRNIGMLACKMGCDDLYELGYIGVDANGTILAVSPDPVEHGDLVAKRLADLAGLPCRAFTVWSAPYFQWHRDTKFPRRREMSDPLATVAP